MVKQSNGALINEHAILFLNADQSIEGPSHNETNDETANQSTSLINETAATNKSEEVLIIDEEDEGGEEVFSDLFLMNVGY